MNVQKDGKCIDEEEEGKLTKVSPFHNVEKFLRVIMLLSYFRPLSKYFSLLDTAAAYIFGFQILYCVTNYEKNRFMLSKKTLLALITNQ